MESLFQVFPLASKWLKDSDDIPAIPDESNEKKDAVAQYPETTILQCLLSNCCGPNNLLLLSESSRFTLPLMFQCAVSHGSDGNRVVFIRHQPLNDIPIGVHGMPQPEASVLKNVKFLYHKNARELVSYCANIHTQTSPLPDVLIVDSLECFITDSKDGSPEQALTELCCIMIDAVAFIRQKSGKSVPLVISVNSHGKYLDHIIWRLPIQTASVEGFSELATPQTCQLIMTIKGTRILINYEAKNKSILLTGVEQELLC